MFVCRGMVLVLYVRLLRRRSGSSSSNCCEVAVAVADDITGELLLLFSDDFCTCIQKVIKVKYRTETSFLALCVLGYRSLMGKWSLDFLCPLISIAFPSAFSS